MNRAPRLLFALLFVTATVPPSARLMALPASGQSGSPTVRPVSATTPDIPFPDDESQAEQQLLALANRSRHEAGAPPLVLDSGLSRAALAHAQIMLDARQLSHQFQGEPSLPQRLAAATHLLLDQEGENVALDYDAEHGHQHLMLSPPHRANLLNPAYNVIGLGVVRSGDRLYIVQDFGHALPTYSSVEVKDLIANAVQQIRRQSNLPDLQRLDLLDSDAGACSMAQADKLATAPVHNLAQRYTVLTYTSVHPESLPAQASHAISSHNVHSFSIGSCYAHTATYPTGVYWIVVALD